MTKIDQHCSSCLKYAGMKWNSYEIKYFEFHSDLNIFTRTKSNLYKPYWVLVENFRCTKCGHNYIGGV